MESTSGGVGKRKKRSPYREGGERRRETSRTPSGSCEEPLVRGMHPSVPRVAPIVAAYSASCRMRSSAAATAIRTRKTESGVTEIDVIPHSTRKGGISSG